ncbi:MAG: hypothetical protein M0Z87_09880 [Actinomycetota bacterium]|nr:hypothetical protein [Actinomycetota bacterium]
MVDARAVATAVALGGGIEVAGHPDHPNVLAAPLAARASVGGMVPIQAGGAVGDLKANHPS